MAKKLLLVNINANKLYIQLVESVTISISPITNNCICKIFISKKKIGVLTMLQVKQVLESKVSKKKLIMIEFVSVVPAIPS